MYYMNACIYVYFYSWIRALFGAENPEENTSEMRFEAMCYTSLGELVSL